MKTDRGIAGVMILLLTVLSACSQSTGAVGTLSTTTAPPTSANAGTGLSSSNCSLSLSLGRARTLVVARISSAPTGVVNRGYFDKSSSIIQVREWSLSVDSVLIDKPSEVGFQPAHPRAGDVLSVALPQGDMFVGQLDAAKLAGSFVAALIPGPIDGKPGWYLGAAMIMSANHLTLLSAGCPNSPDRVLHAAITALGSPADDLVGLQLLSDLRDSDVARFNSVLQAANIAVEKPVDWESLPPESRSLALDSVPPQEAAKVSVVTVVLNISGAGNLPSSEIGGMSTLGTSGWVLLTASPTPLQVPFANDRSTSVSVRQRSASGYLTRTVGQILASDLKLGGLEIDVSVGNSSSLDAVVVRIIPMSASSAEARSSALTAVP